MIKSIPKFPNFQKFKIKKNIPKPSMCEKCPHTELFFVRIFSVLSPNMGKYGPEITPYLDTFDAVHTFFLLSTVKSFINHSSTNVPFTDKPDNWFLLAKCHSSTGVFKDFASKNELLGFHISGTLVENGLIVDGKTKTTLLDYH